MLYVFAGLIIVSMALNFFDLDHYSPSIKNTIRVFSNLAIIAAGVVGLYAGEIEGMEWMEGMEWKALLWGMILSGCVIVLWQIRLFANKNLN